MDSGRGRPIAAMRAMIAGLVLVLAGTASCGGETIDYSATPTPLFRIPAGGLVVDPSVFRAAPSEQIDLSQLVRAIEGRDPADVALSGALREWANAVDDGATSREELRTICSASPDATAVEPTAAQQVCADVRVDAHQRTLRQWADLIHERVSRAAGLLVEERDD